MVGEPNKTGAHLIEQAKHLSTAVSVIKLDASAPEVMPQRW